MAFTPDSPTNPQDLYATFDGDNRLSGLVYNSDEGLFTRILGEWKPLEGSTNPFGSGVEILFVKPSFIVEYDARTMRNEFPAYEDLVAAFGAAPKFDTFRNGI